MGKSALNDSGAAATRGDGTGVSEAARAEAARCGLELRRGAKGLELTDGALTLRADLSALASRIAPGRIGRELLVRAARIKGADAPRAVDATAGLGEDSLLLAAAGFRVTLCECNPAIAALLRDALARAADDERLSPIVARMELVEGDGIAALSRLAKAHNEPDLVYLDPMFPGRAKSAAVKKKFQLLHRLERPCDDEAALLAAARAANPRKIAIKRPVKAPYLAGEKPSYSLSGKAVRYDVIALARA